jgi:hypothetical protein
MGFEEQIKNKINEFGGIEELLIKLRWLECNSDPITSNMICQIGLFYGLTFRIETDWIKDTKRIRHFLEEAIERFQSLNELKHDRTLDFLIELISFQLQYVKGIKFLNIDLYIR